MTDTWRELLYPLGFLSTLAFTLRMLAQWLTSEAKGKSVVMPIFWKLSLFGNCLLLIHSLIQVQFHVCLIQACNALISWRNLNLMQNLKRQLSLFQVIQLLLLIIGTIIILFMLQGYFLLQNPFEWFRIPTAPWQQNNEMNLLWTWHLLGFIGLALFSSRFWFQWWCIEKYKESYLGAGFWWVSLIGEGLCLVYFLRINDPVNFLGPAFGMIPYTRNLILLYKQKKAVHKA